MKVPTITLKRMLLGKAGWLPLLLSGAFASQSFAHLSPLPSSSRLGQSQSQSSEIATDVVGVVVDARNRSPIARALVRFENRAVLTNHDGIFTFPQVTSTTATFGVVKPGFYSSPDGEIAQSRSYRLPATSPIEILIYPEAILSGSVVNEGGEGMSGLSVTAQRSVFDESGAHWVFAGQTQTTSAGEFHLAVPPGSYTLHVTPRGRPTGGAEIVLPLSVPALSSSGAEAIRVMAGEETHLALRADIRRVYTVSVRFAPESRGFPVITAKSTSGVILPLSVVPSHEQGEARVALPPGSYTLHATIQNQEGLSEADTQVTVTDHDLSGTPLHFSRAAHLPVVVEMDASASLERNAKLPDVLQIGLSLQPSGPSAEANSPTVRVVQQKAGQVSFPVPAGVYRLHAQPGGQWYVASATCGGIDLLNQDLPVTAGLDGTEMRVRISNNTATLFGKVTISGVPGPAWIYLLAADPSASPVLVVRSNPDGSFFRPNLAPGSYRVVSLERRVNADLRDSAILSPYLDHVQSFTVTPGEQRTLTLGAVTEKEFAP